MKTRSFSQQNEFNATPAQLYEIIMDEKKHAAVTGAPAKITNRKGGKFTAWDGYITGKTIELIKNKKIVQEWHASDMPEGHVSLITFEFIPLTSQTTLLKFTHTDAPATLAESYEQGWYEYYWDPIKRFLHNR